MKSQTFALIIFLLLISCKQNDKTVATNWTSISNEIKYRESEEVLEINTGKFTYNIEKKSLPYQKIMLLNASLAGYFLELGKQDNIIGVSSPEYFYSEKIRKNIADNKTVDVGNEQKFDVEKIIAHQPDVIFTNYVQSFENTYAFLRKNGVNIIFIDEYLIQKPLERTKLILLFGKLLGEEKLAKERYSEISQRYTNLTKIAAMTSQKPEILVNEMYGNQWFLPGGASYVAQYIKDAGGKYILAENKDDRAIPLSFEEVFKKSENAQYWINAGNHISKTELLTVNPNYAKMNIYQKGNIYTINGRAKDRSNDYFESGTVRADLMLKDYIKIFHPNILPGYTLTYLKKLD